MSERICRQAYVGAMSEPCATCGAPAGQPCTYDDLSGAPRTRRIPCITRIHPDDIHLPDDPPPHVDFAEPRHERTP